MLRGSPGAMPDEVSRRSMEQERLRRTFTRSYREEADIAFSAIDCVLNGEKAVYASSELTTGRRVNSILREVGLRRSSELRPKLGEEEYRTRIWNPNVAAAMAFARKLHHTLGQDQIVITPAPFAAPGWNQSEYLAFWEQLIGTRIRAVYFNDGWQYSDGCTFEFLIALDRGLPTFDVEGKPLSASAGATLVESAIGRLQHDGQEFETLASYLSQLSHGMPLSTTQEESR